MKKIIGISLILLAMLGIGLAVTFNSKLDAFSWITTEKAKNETIDVTKIIINVTTPKYCKINYETEEVEGCPVGFEWVYNDTENYMQGDEGMHLKNDTTDAQDKKVIWDFVYNRIDDELKWRKQNVRYLEKDMTGTVVTSKDVNLGAEE